MKPVAYMIWAPFTGPAQFTTDHSAPEKTAQRADYTCTPLVTERDAIAAIEQADRWRLAVDQLLSGWYSTADSYASPQEAIKALIAFEVMAALDPKVSSDAAALVEQARREAFEEAAQIAASYGAPVVPVVQRVTARDIADAIRARGENKNG